jgi:hypothetical protein
VRIKELCLILEHYQPLLILQPFILYTISFNTKKNRVSTHRGHLCFVPTSRQTVIISLHNINIFVFITEMHSVYYAVRADFLNTIQLILIG